MLNQKGFTLVEIAIVLVVVGLLIGGVLKGQEMITNAKIKRMQRDNAGIAAAMLSYQDRYLQLPGDDSNAQGRFTIYTAATDNGDGDGFIGLGTDWDMATTTPWVAGGQETLKFFAHLRASGLVPGSPTDSTRPTNTYGGQIGVQDGSLLISGHVMIFGAIDGPIARIFETRLDDTDPSTGRIQANEVGNAAGMDAGAATGAGAAYTDTVRYDMAFRL